MITEQELKIMELYPFAFPANTARGLSRALGPSNFDKIIEKIRQLAMEGCTGFTVSNNEIDNLCVNILEELGYDISFCENYVIIGW